MSAADVWADPAYRMLAEAVAGLAPYERAKKMQKIALRCAEKNDAEGNREKASFWRDLANTAAAEALRLSTETIRTPLGYEITILKA